MSLSVENFGKDYTLTLKGRMSHRVTLGTDARGNLTRIDNALAAMPERLKTEVQSIWKTCTGRSRRPKPRRAKYRSRRRKN